MARLTLIGNLGADPETRSTKNDRQFVTLVGNFVFGTPNAHGKLVTLLRPRPILLPTLRPAVRLCISILR